MFEFKATLPKPEEFVEMRILAGLTPRSLSAAQKGLQNSLFCICIYHNNQFIGMGRVIGDGGLNFEICDVMVHPDYQGQGLGNQIMQHIENYLEKHAPEGSICSLLADVPELYQKFNYIAKADCIGMFKNF